MSSSTNKVTDSEFYKSLKSLVEDHNDFSYTGKRALLQNIETWFESWVIEAKSEISVTNTKYLSAEYEDILKYKLCELLADAIAEESAIFNLKEQKISAKIVTIRRAAKDGSSL